MRVDAILPAGGRISGPFAHEAGTEVKALIQLGGWTVLERTLASLGATGHVGRTVVIGPEEVISHQAARSADVALSEGSSGPANIFRGLEWLYAANDSSYPERVLILTTDLPFLTADAITQFLDVCPSGLDLCIPILRREEFEARFSYRSARYVHLRDGEWMIGCAFLVDPVALVRNRSAIERVFAARRSRLGMARLLGPSFVLRFLTRCLTVAHIEQRPGPSAAGESPSRNPSHVLDTTRDLFGESARVVYGGRRCSLCADGGKSTAEGRAMRDGNGRRHRHPIWSMASAAKPTGCLTEFVDCRVCRAPNASHREGCFNCGSLLCLLRAPDQW